MTSNTSKAVKATCYTNTGCGDISAEEINIISIERGDYAQYQDVPCMTFKGKGKRKAYRRFFTDRNKYNLIIAGWDHPAPREAGTVEDGIKTVVFDFPPAAEAPLVVAFDAMISAEIAAGRVSVIADHRCEMPTIPAAEVKTEAA